MTKVIKLNQKLIIHPTHSTIMGTLHAEVIGVLKGQRPPIYNNDGGMLPHAPLITLNLYIRGHLNIPHCVLVSVLD